MIYRFQSEEIKRPHWGSGNGDIFAYTSTKQTSNLNGPDLRLAQSCFQPQPVLSLSMIWYLLSLGIQSKPNSSWGWRLGHADLTKFEIWLYVRRLFLTFLSRWRKYDSKKDNFHDVTTKQGITVVFECPTIDINEIGDGWIQYRSIRRVRQWLCIGKD